MIANPPGRLTEERAYPALRIMAAEDGLKAQKLLAQGIALGNVCKKQSRPERANALKLKAFALSGRQVYIHKYPGRCPGLGASALSGRVDANTTWNMPGIA